MRYRVTCRDRSSGQTYVVEYDTRSPQAAEHLALLGGHAVESVGTLEGPSAPTPRAEGGGVLPAPAGMPRRAAPPDTKAIFSLALGAVGILAACVPLVGLPMNVTGLALGLLSNTPGGVRSCGIILSSVGIALTVVSGVLGVLAVSNGWLP
ncbi:MAG: hypothetical protein SFY69_10075 [Planctomycetota bacterium]|nr:hypothetical protein [Planctomycetota bacterium]